MKTSKAIRLPSGWALLAAASGAATLCLAQADPMQPVPGASAQPTQTTQPANAADLHVSEQVIQDSNLFRVPANLDLRSTGLGNGATRDDVSEQTTVSGTGSWSLGQQRLALLATLNDNRFDHNSDLNNVSGHGSLDWLWALGTDWSGRAGADYQRTLASFVNTRFLGKDLFTTVTYSGEARYQVGPRWSLHALGQYADNQHNNTARQVDDFQSRSGTLGIEYQTDAGNTLGSDYRRTSATFPEEIFLNGAPLERNYREDEGRFNLKYALTGKTVVKASTGFLRREYPQTSIGRFSGGVWNASLDWQPRSKLRFTAAAWRELRAYLDAQSDHFVSRAQSLSAAWMPRSSLTLSLELSSEDQDYLGTGLNEGLSTGTAQGLPSLTPSRVDRTRAGEARVSWVSVRPFSFDIAYRLERRDSTLEQFRYDDASVRVGFAFRF